MKRSTIYIILGIAAVAIAGALLYFGRKRSKQMAQDAQLKAAAQQAANQTGTPQVLVKDTQGNQAVVPADKVGATANSGIRVSDVFAPDNGTTSPLSNALEQQKRIPISNAIFN